MDEPATGRRSDLVDVTVVDGLAKARFPAQTP